ncbi:MAG: hypothetical protein QM499_12640 [Flavobacteriaceae bacterium]
MNTLINLVLSIVLNLLSIGTHQPKVTQVSSQQIMVCEQSDYHLKDLNSHYLITNEEVSKSLVRIKVENISTN